MPANLAAGACWWFTLLMSSEDRGRDELADAHEAHSEPHEVDLERREAAVAEREVAVAERETAQAERMNVAETTLAAADERDAVSDTATQRPRSASTTPTSLRCWTRIAITAPTGPNGDTPPVTEGTRRTTAQPPATTGSP